MKLYFIDEFMKKIGCDNITLLADMEKEGFLIADEITETGKSLYSKDTIKNFHKIYEVYCFSKTRKIETKKEEESVAIKESKNTPSPTRTESRPASKTQENSEPIININSDVRDIIKETISEKIDNKAKTLKTEDIKTEILSTKNPDAFKTEENKETKTITKESKKLKETLEKNENQKDGVLSILTEKAQDLKHKKELKKKEEDKKLERVMKMQKNLQTNEDAQSDKKDLDDIIKLNQDTQVRKPRVKKEAVDILTKIAKIEKENLEKIKENSDLKELELQKWNETNNIQGRVKRIDSSNSLVSELATKRKKYF